MGIGRPVILASIPFSKAIERASSADINPAVNNGWCCETLIFHVVYRQHFPTRASLEYTQPASLAQHENFAIARHWGGVILLQSTSEALLLENSACQRIKAGRNAPVAHQVKHSSIEQWRGHVRQRFAVTPYYISVC